MKTTWDILTKELAIFGIKLINSNLCECTESGKKLRIPIRYKLRLIRKSVCRNLTILKELWGDLCKILGNNDIVSSSAIDIRSTNLFISSIQGLVRFSTFILDDYIDYIKTMDIESIKLTLKKYLNRDINTIDKSVILLVPEYKISIDWIHRIIRQLIYISKLLKCAMTGTEIVKSIPEKFARGVQGPWANLDLPMLERAFEWDDIEAETRGRDADIRKQRRYKMGLENYNGDGRVGEGFYWREIRNEPFSWYDRNTEDPYPGRSILTRS